jgi:hypothetical protein
MEQDRPLEQIKRLNWNLLIERFALAIVVNHQVLVYVVCQEVVQASNQV